MTFDEKGEFVNGRTSEESDSSGSSPAERKRSPEPGWEERFQAVGVAAGWRAQGSGKPQDEAMPIATEALDNTSYEMWDSEYSQEESEEWMDEHEDEGTSEASSIS